MNTLLSKAGIDIIKHRDFVSERAPFFRNVRNRFRQLPRSPLDLIKTHRRIESVESTISAKIEKAIALEGNDWENEMRQRLEQMPYNLAYYQLNRVKYIGDTKAKALLSYFPSLAAMYDAPIKEFEDNVDGVGAKLAQSIKDHLRTL